MASTHPGGTQFAALPRNRLDRTAIATVVLLCALWGIQQVGTKVAVEQGLPPMVQATVRSAVAALLLCGFVALRSGWAGLRALTARDGTLAPGLLIAAMFAGEFLFLFEGIPHTTASRAVLFLYTAPFFTAIGAHLLIPNERLSAVQAFGLLCAFAGIALTVRDPGVGGTGLGDGLVTIGACLLGLTTVVVKRSRRLAAITPAKVLLYQLGFSTPILLLAGVLLGQFGRFPQATALAWGALAYQGVVVAFASYLTWFWLISRYPAGRLAAFTFLTPLFGIAAGALLLNEPANLSLLLALVCVGVGLRLVNTRAAPVPAAAPACPRESSAR